jgi:hypothetical protein
MATISMKAKGASSSQENPFPKDLSSECLRSLPDAILMGADFGRWSGIRTGGRSVSVAPEPEPCNGDRRFLTLESSLA